MTWVKVQSNYFNYAIYIIKFSSNLFPSAPDFKGLENFSLFLVKNKVGVRIHIVVLHSAGVW